MPGGTRARVVIAGGGLAGIEAALALHELAPGLADVTVVEPRARFAVPATAAGHAFGIGWSIDRPMRAVIDRAGARPRSARLVAIDARRRIAMLAGGELMPYDHLIVAVGARPEPWLPDALTFRGHADVEELRALVDGIAESAARGARPELAIVVPEPCGWPLAGYDIALMTHEHLVAAGRPGGCRITVLSAEEAPLAAFGDEVGATVTGTLGRAGVAIRTGTRVRDFVWGALELEDGEVIGVDRVVCLPRLAGPRIEGLPCDPDGFVTCAADGTVAGAPGVRVVGDAASAPVRQGGLACRQADDAARAIAAEIGAAGDRRANGNGSASAPDDAWDPAGRWHGDGRVGTADEALPWPVPRLSGRHLAPFLNELTRPLPVL